jgi:hypothetical protein
VEATVVIRSGKITVEEGLNGPSDVHLTADSATWLGCSRAGKESAVGTADAPHQAAGKSPASAGVQALLSVVSPGAGRSNSGRGTKRSSAGEPGPMKRRIPTLPCSRLTVDKIRADVLNAASRSSYF